MNLDERFPELRRDFRHETIPAEELWSLSGPWEVAVQRWNQVIFDNENGERLEDDQKERMIVTLGRHRHVQDMNAAAAAVFWLHNSFSDAEPTSEELLYIADEESKDEPVKLRRLGVIQSLATQMRGADPLFDRRPTTVDFAWASLHRVHEMISTTISPYAMSDCAGLVMAQVSFTVAGYRFWHDSPKILVLAAIRNASLPGRAQELLDEDEDAGPFISDLIGATLPHMNQVMNQLYADLGLEGGHNGEAVADASDRLWRNFICDNPNCWLEKFQDKN